MFGLLHYNIREDNFGIDSKSQSTTTTAMDNLAVIKAVVETLQEYIAIKEGMAAAAASTITSQ
jgi:hypothetical protein